MLVYVLKQSGQPFMPTERFGKVRRLLKEGKNLKYATHMSIIRSRLLREYPNAIETFVFVTSENRNHLQLPKDHYIDACVIASGGLEFKEFYRKRRVSKQDRILTKGVRGEKRMPTGKVHGFKRYDKVKYLGTVCFIKGRRTKGSFVLMDIDNNAINFRNSGGKSNPSYKSIKRINTRESSLCMKCDVTIQRVLGRIIIR